MPPSSSSHPAAVAAVVNFHCVVWCRVGVSAVFLSVSPCGLTHRGTSVDDMHWFRSHLTACLTACRQPAFSYHREAVAEGEREGRGWDARVSFPHP